MAKLLTLDEQFEMLQVQIQSSLELPCVIVVTSARARDGKSATAFGLARSMSRVGIRTALVDANHVAARKLPAFNAPSDLVELADGAARQYAYRFGPERVEMISLATDAVRSSASRESVDRAFAALRSVYHTVIVDTAPMVESSLARLMAGRADATVLTVREGRSVRRDDRELMRMLDADRIEVLGTVSVAPSAIRDARRQTLRPVPALATARAGMTIETGRAQSIVG